MKIVIQILLWVVIGVLGYLLFNSIYGEVQFNKVKEKRYKATIATMKQLRVAQLAHKTVTGEYQGDFNKLVRFIDTADFTLTRRRDTVVRDEEESNRLQVDITKTVVKVDTLGTRSVKDSLFKGRFKDSYKTMINVPVEGIDNPKFIMNAGFIEKSNLKIPVFEIKVAKDVLLKDQVRDYVIKENQVKSVDGVNGKFLSVGSMDDINTSGNWPKSYGTNDE